MKPSVEEQLEGTCRILETLVLPAVSEPYARTIFVNLIANLRMVTAALPKVTGFIRNDNAATLQLLLALSDALPPDLVIKIDQAAAADKPGADDERGAETRNDRLRQLLADAVCSPRLTLDQRQSIEHYMINRASHAPMRYVPTVAAIAVNMKG